MQTPSPILTVSVYQNLLRMSTIKILFANPAGWADMSVDCRVCLISAFALKISVSCKII